MNCELCIVDIHNYSEVLMDSTVNLVNLIQ